MLGSKNKNIEEKNLKKIDKRLYRFDNLLSYVEQAYSQYLDSQEGGTSEEIRKEKDRKKQLRSAANDCHAGIEKDKELVKQFIMRLLTGGVEVYLREYGDNYLIDRHTVDMVFNWKNKHSLPTQVKFMCILWKYKYTYGKDALGTIISKYEINKLRKIETIYEAEREVLGMYFSKEDVCRIFEEEIKEEITFETKIDIIVQMVYEEFKGNGAIDEILYQNVDDISIGVNGLTDEVTEQNNGEYKIPYSYDGAWIVYKGALINMSFISLGSFRNLRRVVRNIASYKQTGEFSTKEGYKLGYGKDNSRRTAVISPFGESEAAWVRKFTAKTLTNKDMVQGGKNDFIGYEKVLKTERMLVMGGATIPICGPQGAGKTTKLVALMEYIQNFYSIRMIESEFEARARLKYPEKNIFTMQTSEKTPEEAYEFSLRTSGSIYVISEVRSDEMAVNITRTANRGGRSVMFTYHPNKPKATVLEIANSLIRQKLYTSLKDAMYTTLDAIKCCIHIDTDLETGCRHYNIYEFIPLELPLSDGFKTASEEDKPGEFMNTVYDYFRRRTSEEFFDVVPIVTFDRFKGRYSFNNNISEALYNELMLKMSLNSERDELERTFRPNRAIKRYVEDGIIPLEKLMDEERLSEIIKEFEFTEEFLDKEALREEYKEKCDSGESMNGWDNMYDR